MAYTQTITLGAPTGLRGSEDPNGILYQTDRNGVTSAIAVRWQWDINSLQAPAGWQIDEELIQSSHDSVNYYLGSFRIGVLDSFIDGVRLSIGTASNANSEDFADDLIGNWETSAIAITITCAGLNLTIPGPASNIGTTNFDAEEPYTWTLTGTHATALREFIVAYGNLTDSQRNNTRIALSDATLDELFDLDQNIAAGTSSISTGEINDDGGTDPDPDPEPEPENDLVQTFTIGAPISYNTTNLAWSTSPNQWQINGQLMASGNAAWIGSFYILLNRSHTIWFTTTAQIGQGSTTAGPDLISDWEIHLEALTIECAGLSFTIPGPASSQVSPIDTTEPYRWTLSGDQLAAHRAFITAYRRLSSAQRLTTTLTLRGTPPDPYENNIDSGDSSISTGAPKFVLDQNVNAGSASISTGDISAPLLQLSDFDDTGLDMDVLGLFESESPEHIYADSNIGGDSELIDGEFGIGAGETLITRISIRSGGRIRINDNNIPESLSLSAHYGSSQTTSDWTLYIQTSDGVVSSNTLGYTGTDYLYFVFNDSDDQDLINAIDDGDRVIFGIGQDAPQDLGSLSIDAGSSSITTGSPKFVLDQEIESGNASISTGEHTITEPELQLSDFDDTGLDMDVLGLFESESPEHIYADSNIGGDSELIDGEFGIGAGETLITRISIRSGGRIRINDNNIPESLSLSAHYGSSQTTSDWTLYIQTSDGVVSSNTLGYTGTDYLYFVFNDSDDQDLINAIDDGDRVIFGIGQDAPQDLGSLSIDAGSSSITTGSPKFVLDQEIESGNASISTGEHTITEPELQLSDFDDTGLDMDVLGLFESESPEHIYADSNIGGDSELIDGEFGIGAGETLITRISIRSGGRIRINDNNIPESLSLSAHYGSSQTTSDWTLYIQTSDGVVSSNTLGYTGTDYLYFVFNDSDDQDLINAIDDGDRVIFGIGQDAPQDLGSLSIDAGSSSITTGSPKFVLDQEIESGNASISTGEHTITEPELQLLDFDDIGLEVDTLGLFEASASGTIYADSNRGGTSELEEGEFGMGDGETLITRIVVRNSGRYVRLNDNDVPDPLSLSAHFGSSNTTSDWTLYIQTSDGVVSSNDLQNVGGGWVNFEFATADRSLLDDISTGDRVILAIAQPEELDLNQGITAGDSSVNTGASKRVHDQTIESGSSSIETGASTFVLDQDISSGQTSISTGASSFVLDQKIESGNASISTGEHTITEPELQLLDFDDIGLEVDTLGLFEASASGTIYADSNRGGTSELEEGEFGMGDGETLITRIVVRNSGRYVRLNDNDVPDPLSLSAHFGSSNTTSDWTLYIQTSDGVVSSNDLQNVGGGWVNFEFATADRSLLDDISTGDRVILAIAQPEELDLNQGITAGDSSVNTGASKRVHDQTIESGSSSIETGASTFVLDQDISSGQTSISTGASSFVLDQKIEAGISEIQTGAAEFVLGQDISAGSSSISTGEHDPFLLQLSDFDDIGLSVDFLALIDAEGSGVIHTSGTRWENSNSNDLLGGELGMSDNEILVTRVGFFNGNSIIRLNDQPDSFNMASYIGSSNSVSSWTIYIQTIDGIISSNQLSTTGPDWANFTVSSQTDINFLGAISAGDRILVALARPAINQQIESGTSTITTGIPKFALDQTIESGSSSISTGSSKFVLGQTIDAGISSVNTGANQYQLDQEINSGTSEISTGVSAAVLDQNIEAGDSSITTGDVGFNLTLDDFNDAGLDMDTLGIFVASNDASSSSGIYRDSNRGGTSTLDDGEFGMGDGETLITWIRVVSNGRYVTLNDNNVPSELFLSTHFGTSITDSDWTLYVQTLTGVVESNRLGNVGGGYVNFEFSDFQDQRVLTSISAGDQVIVGIGQPITLEQNVESGSTMVDTGTHQFQLDQEIESGNATIITGAPIFVLDQNISTRGALISTGTHHIAIDQNIEAGESSIVTGAHQFQLDQSISAGLNEISSGSAKFYLDQTVDAGNANINTGAARFVLGQTVDGGQSSIVTGAPQFDLDQTVDSGISEIDTGAVKFVLDQNIESGNTSIGTGAHQFQLDQEIESGANELSTGVPIPVLDQIIDSGISSIDTGAAIFVLGQDVESGNSEISTGSIKFQLDQEIESGASEISTGEHQSLLDQIVNAGSTSIITGSPRFVLDQTIFAGSAVIETGANEFRLDQNIESGDTSVSVGEIRFQFDSTGLLVDAVGGFVAESRPHIYADTNREGTSVLTDGEFGLGDTETLISRITTNTGFDGTYVRLNDDDIPEELIMSEFFGPSNTESEWTLYLQTKDGVISSNQLAGVGGGFVNFEFVDNADRLLLLDIEPGDRVIVAIAKPTPLEQDISVGNASISTGSSRFVLDQEIEAGESEIDVGAPVLLLDQTISAGNSTISIGASRFVLDQTIDAGESTIITGVLIGINSQNIESGESTIEVGVISQSLTQIVSSGDSRISIGEVTIGDPTLMDAISAFDLPFVTVFPRTASDFEFLDPPEFLGSFIELRNKYIEFFEGNVSWDYEILASLIANEYHKAIIEGVNQATKNVIHPMDRDYIIRSQSDRNRLYGCLKNLFCVDWSKETVYSARTYTTDRYCKELAKCFTSYWNPRTVSVRRDIIEPGDDVEDSTLNWRLYHSHFWHEDASSHNEGLAQHYDPSSGGITDASRFSDSMYPWAEWISNTANVPTVDLSDMNICQNGFFYPKYSLINHDYYITDLCNRLHYHIRSISGEATFTVHYRFEDDDDNVTYEDRIVSGDWSKYFVELEHPYHDSDN